MVDDSRGDYAMRCDATVSKEMDGYSYPLMDIVRQIYRKGPDEAEYIILKVKATWDDGWRDGRMMGIKTTHHSICMY